MDLLMDTGIPVSLVPGAIPGVLLALNKYFLD